jgi:hypothetical protein
MSAQRDDPRQEIEDRFPLLWRESDERLARRAAILEDKILDSWLCHG